MEYLPLFLLFAAALIAGWFYLQRAKARDAAKQAVAEKQQAPAAEPHHTAADSTAPSDRRAD